MKLLKTLFLCLFTITLFLSPSLAQVPNPLRIPEFPYPHWADGWNPGSAEFPNPNCTLISCTCDCNTEEHGSAESTEFVCVPHDCSALDGYTCGPVQIGQNTILGIAANCE